MSKIKSKYKKKVSIIFKNNSYHIDNPRTFEEIMCNLDVLEDLISQATKKRDEYMEIENKLDLPDFQDDVFNFGILLGKATALRWIIGKEWGESIK